jgi:hypothetical protein
MFSVVFKMFTISPHAFFNPLSIFTKPFFNSRLQAWLADPYCKACNNLVRSQAGWILQRLIVHAFSTKTQTECLPSSQNPQCLTSFNKKSRQIPLVAGEAEILPNHPEGSVSSAQRGLGGFFKCVKPYEHPVSHRACPSHAHD